MNKSGIYPSANRVVVKPDDIERKTDGGIIIADSVADKHAMAQTTGVLIAVGPDAYKESTSVTERWIENGWKPVERTVTGYSKPFAEVGQRVAFAKYGGLEIEGEDGERYRILNDLDITAVVSAEVNFTDLKSRKRVGT